jgi:hypothetical protein
VAEWWEPCSGTGRHDARTRGVREQLLAFANQVNLAFNEIKAARRLLRTYGFDAPEGRILSAEQATGFRGQMAQLNDTQLSMEMYGRVVEAQPELFEPSGAELRHELSSASEYLRQVLLEWQTDPTVVESGADASPLAGWQRFLEFVGYGDASRAAFRAGIAEPLGRIELMLMRSGAPPAEVTGRTG